MKVSKAIQTGKVTLEEVINFMEGNILNDEIQKSLNEITGFESTKIQCDDNWDSDTILECELIEEDIF